MKNRGGRPREGLCRVRLHTTIEALFRDFITTILDRDVSEYLAGKILADLDTFLAEDHTTAPQEVQDFITRAGQDLPQIKEIRGSKARRDTARKEALVGKGDPLKGDPVSALVEYCRGLLPSQIAILKRAVERQDSDGLRGYQEEIERRTGIWVKPAVFTRRFIPQVDLEIPEGAIPETRGVDP
jgi:hypothetical protein